MRKHQRQDIWWSHLLEAEEAQLRWARARVAATLSEVDPKGTTEIREEDNLIIEDTVMEVVVERTKKKRKSAFLRIISRL